MSKIDLTWDADGVPESYTVYRSESSMDINNLPTALATGITDKFYSDETVVDGVNYYYRVASVKGSAFKLSSEIDVLAVGFSAVKLLIFADGNTIVDSSLDERIINNNGVTLSTAVPPKYDEKSLYFNGSSYLSTSIYQLGISDFTLELFLRVTSGSSWSPIFKTSDLELLKRVESDRTTLLLSVNGVNVFVSDTVYVTNLTWCHVCLMRKNGRFFLFVDGVTSGDTTSQSSYVLVGTDLIILNGFVAYANSIRLSNVARYNETGFTVPTEKFPTS